MRLAGVVTLFQPNKSVIENIKSYINSLDVLYVLDNSEQPDIMIVDKIKQLINVCYIPFYENRGIAYALNYAVKNSRNYDCLLTMDQDSAFPAGMMGRYKQYITKWQSNDETIGCYSINFLERAENSGTANEFVDVAITSGMIINLRLPDNILKFEEKLFIDEVDHEFCYRLRKNGYRILQCCDIHLRHAIGKSKQYKVGGITGSVRIHAPIRSYYMMRNRLYIMNRFPEIRTAYAIKIIKMFIRLLFFEKDKYKRFHYMLKGIADFKKDKMGKFENDET